MDHLLVLAGKAVCVCGSHCSDELARVVPCINQGAAAAGRCTHQLHRISRSLRMGQRHVVLSEHSGFMCYALVSRCWISVCLCLTVYLAAESKFIYCRSQSWLSILHPFKRYGVLFAMSLSRLLQSLYGTSCWQIARTVAHAAALHHMYVICCWLSDPGFSAQGTITLKSA